ncbi:60S ribosomal protein [Grosmannia clavigera kw1407]|uniref:60S ribosomal protein n=1 Tax=Grosmannia clavigera (strain kw1407 / UAMH 11150) TaxID=655863 RepID=F0XKK8_GROCL|nr:60S ribosomal protein [Grosmannia clavigera kw1407]EFX01763.1 60S ribosomal protein [Grosmannia clavigera kw1407]
MASPATGSPSGYIQLAKTLPPRLLQFLARYPPAALQPTTTSGDAAAHTSTGYQQDTPNPFKSMKHPVTGRWHDPVYSLRRQAELAKMARDHGVAELLPESSKSPEERLRRRIELGVRVKGTGVGQRVKGHQHERHLVAKMEERRKAMLNMPKLIREWKQVGKKNWTRYPS